MKKQLLQESEIRKMMKFANIGALSNGFVDRLTEAEEADETVDEGMYSEEEMEETLSLEEQDADPMDDMPADDEPADDMELEDPGAEGDLELSEEEAQVLVDLGERLAGQLGGDMDDDMGDDMGDLDVEDELGDMPDEGDDMEPVMEMAHPDDEKNEGLGEDLVNEVARRVSKRLAALRG